MTKIFDLKLVDGFLYMVDNQKCKGGDWEIVEDKLNLVSDDVEDAFIKVLATNNPSIHIELPKLPAVEEDWYKASDEYRKLIKDGNTTTEFVNKMQGFIDGYKAAKAKKYSEEDMRKAYTEGWSERYNSREEKIQGFDSFIQSLNPIPKQVEVEMNSPYFDTEYQEMRERPNSELKLKTVNNIVQVKRWIY